MAEYIKRKKVYKMLNALGGCGAEPDSWANGWDRAIDTAIEELDEIPAADVRLERHGYWENDEALSEECKTRCSRCKTEYEWENLNNMQLGYVVPYCPNCGAKMND